MNDKIKHQWDENIKPMIMFVLVGVMITIGMRLTEIVWQKESAKVIVCLASEIGKIDTCKPFEKDG